MSHPSSKLRALVRGLSSAPSTSPVPSSASPPGDDDIVVVSAEFAEDAEDETPACESAEDRAPRGVVGEMMEGSSSSRPRWSITDEDVLPPLRLTKREQEFVQMYCETCDPVSAGRVLLPKEARSAAHDATVEYRARSAASEMLRRPHVRGAVERAGMNAMSVFRRMAGMASLTLGQLAQDVTVPSQVRLHAAREILSRGGLPAVVKLDVTTPMSDRDKLMSDLQALMGGASAGEADGVGGPDCDGPDCDGPDAYGDAPEGGY